MFVFQKKSTIQFVAFLSLLVLMACHKADSNRFKLDNSADQKSTTTLSMTTGWKTTTQSTNQPVLLPIFVIEKLDNVTKQQTSEKIKIDIQLAENANSKNNILIEFASDQNTFYYGHKTNNTDINFFELTFNKTNLKFRTKCMNETCETIRLCGYYLTNQSVPLCPMALELNIDKDKNYRLSKYILLKEYDFTNETKVLEIKCDDSPSNCYNL